MTSSRRLPVPRVRSRRLKTGVGCVLLAGLTVLNAPLRAASTLLAVAPSGASATVSIQVTGSGFDLTAANHEVTFRATTGETAVAVPTAVVMVDPVRGLRRLTLRVPAGLPIGRADLTVLNRITGESITGLWLEVVALTLPDVRSGAPGATNLRVRITGSANAKFAPGSRAVFGTGVTVVSTTVESPTSVMATITIAAGAAVGPRAVTVITTTQTVTLPDGFLVSATPPSNRDPIASANGPYSGVAAQLISFSSAGSSDPDADPLQFAWTFGDGTTATDANPQHAYATAGTYSATLALSDGRGGTASATSSVVVVPPPNRPPTAVVNGPYAGNTGDSIVFSSAGSTDPDGDALQFAWDFGDTGTSVERNPQHAYLAPGPFTVSLTVTDGRGGSANASTQAVVTTRVTLVSLLVEPPALRYSDLNLTTALVVTGRFSDGSERNLTVGSTGTTYTSSALQIATASLDGVVTSIGNGGASIVVANGGIAQAVPVVVEQGVILQALELMPPSMTLREIGSSAPTTLRGRFSDGSLRDLTRDPGTRYSIDEVTTASISSVGLVNALAPGAATVTGRHGGLSATAQVRVIVTEGSGFLRGEVFDDSRGLPLSGVTATLIVSGGAAVANPSPISSDDRGRFTLPAAAGAAFVKVGRSGFTTVERPADLGRNSVVTLLDSRLTPVDPRVNALQSVFGGEARSTDASASVSVPSGSLDQDVSLRVTPISAQGLQGVLPVGWSPIAAVDLQPAGRRLAQGATLRLPHVDTLASGSSVALARYDDAAHRWVAAGPGRVSDDQRTVSATIEVTGQFALVVPDETPMTPPPAVSGEPLAGVAGVVVPDTSTAAGQVTPRSAPPGEGARAVGTVILQPPAPLSSGAVLRARVSEQFDLLDTSRIVPLQFVQDVVLYARPRLGTAGTLAARLPITPSLPFTIQQLSLGTVRLDVTIAEPTASSAIVGADGGSVTDAAGNVLELPAGALAADLALGLLPLSAGQISTPVPDGFTLLGAVFVDLVGASFDQPARLSIPRPSALALSAQVLVARVITDNAGGRRLKIVVAVRYLFAGLRADGAWRHRFRGRARRRRICLPATGPTAWVHHRSGYRARCRPAGARARDSQHLTFRVPHRLGRHVRRRRTRGDADHGGRHRADGRCRIGRSHARRHQRHRRAQPDVDANRAGRDGHESGDERRQRAAQRVGHRRFLKADRSRHRPVVVGRAHGRSDHGNGAGGVVGEPQAVDRLARGAAGGTHRLHAHAHIRHP